MLEIFQWLIGYIYLYDNFKDIWPLDYKNSL